MIWLYCIQWEIKNSVETDAIMIEKDFCRHGPCTLNSSFEKSLLSFHDDYFYYNRNLCCCVIESPRKIKFYLTSTWYDIWAVPRVFRRYRQCSGFHCIKTDYYHRNCIHYVNYYFHSFVGNFVWKLHDPHYIQNWLHRSLSSWRHGVFWQEYNHWRPYFDGSFLFDTTTENSKRTKNFLKSGLFHL
jgi:hypothetical protein